MRAFGNRIRWALHVVNTGGTALITRSDPAAERQALLDVAEAAKELLSGEMTSLKHRHLREALARLEAEKP